MRKLGKNTKNKRIFTWYVNDAQIKLIDRVRGKRGSYRNHMNFSIR